ncbi:MAG: DUF4398 and OmpA-like domain-containing protein [Deltaproteobacteria bacterium]|nr:DUF4398 and OmpA-like domain-containing protein [Deltaproteobacteria bacterium]
MHVYGSYVTRVVSIAAFATLGVGCATVAPTELVRAREAYQRSTLGLAAARAPAELHKAKASLDKAEESFAEEPTSRRTRDLSYVAERKAQLADAIAEARRADKSRLEAEQEYLTRQQQRAQQTSKALADTRGELADTERSRQAGSRALGAERAARLGAEAKAKEAAEALAKLAAVKEEERGLVITLSGSVLFASNQATLLPSAQTRLNQVADVLLTTKERTLVVEGHTDSQGTSGYNLGLSQRRADAVRTYLISRGYAADLIRARGFGKERPVTENSSVEGRANNRRVEIVVEPKLKASL